MITNTLLLAAALITMAYFLPMMVVFECIILYPLFRIFQEWLGANREIKRMDNNSMTRVITNLSETYEGLDMIKLFNNVR